ncbi:MAG TPA: hypothetical protein VF715_13475 [Thermoleophilaceae bacterium]
MGEGSEWIRNAGAALGVVVALAAVIGVLFAAGVLGSDDSAECDPERPFQRTPPAGMAYGSATPELTDRFIGHVRGAGAEDFGQDDIEIRVVLRAGAYLGNATSMRVPGDITPVRLRDYLSAELSKESEGGSARDLELDGKLVKLVRMKVEDTEVVGVMGAAGCRFVMMQGIGEADVVAAARTLLAED